MEENGEMEFIRQHVAAANAAASGAPAPEADTVESEATEEEVEEVEDSTEEEDSADGGTEAEVEDDDTLYLELDEETEALLNDKYKGDLNAMLRAAREGQSVIGRQGNELGAVRAELEALRAEFAQGLQAAQPYPEWPDEFAETSEQAAALREIADQAFDRRDPKTFEKALQAWHDADPVSAALYRDLKEIQVGQLTAAQQAPVADEATLEDAIRPIFSDYPQFQDDSFQAEVAAELDKTPSLKAVLWGNVPGVSVEERATILREAAQRVVSRQTSETAQQARKRIAVRTSEEARAARVSAQVARGSTAREVGEEKEARTVPMGESGRVLNIDRLNAMLPEEDRL
jgi:hypothetical protein